MYLAISDPTLIDAVAPTGTGVAAYGAITMDRERTFPIILSPPPCTAPPTPGGAWTDCTSLRCTTQGCALKELADAGINYVEGRRRAMVASQ